MSPDVTAPLPLRAGGVSVVLDRSGNRLPRVPRWGADPGDTDRAELLALQAVSVPPLSPGSTDAPVPVSLPREQSLGWLGTPGLTGHRDGADLSVALEVTGATHHQDPESGIAHRVHVQEHDAAGHGDAMYPAPSCSHGTRLTGRTLARAGIQAPAPLPERLVLLHGRREVVAP